MKKEFDLVKEPKYLTVGNRKFNIARIASWRSLEAMRIYNKAVKEPNDSDLEAVDKILDAVIVLFRIDFSVTNIWDWFVRRITTKKYILKKTDFSDLSNFVEEALEPILGPKKKAQEHMQKLIAVEQEILKTMSAEDLAKLYQNLPSLLDGQKTTSSKSSQSKK